MLLDCSPEKHEKFLEKVRRDKIESCKANGLPIPTFESVEDYYIPKILREHIGEKGAVPFDCPCCGGKAKVTEDFGCISVECESCGLMLYDFDRDRAIKRWNRRVNGGNQT